MSCCGQGRAALRAASSARAGEVVGNGERRLLIEYRAGAPVAVRGVATGRLYRFDAASARQYVAEGDAAALLKTQFFVRVD